MENHDKNTIRIGTRNSPLATWQAEQVQKHLVALGHRASLVFIKSEGDLNTTMPIYDIGVEGVFTKALDSALLDKRVDIVVHSLKDVPVTPAKGLRQIAVLPRDNPYDILVYNNSLDFLTDTQAEAVIATGSIRRRAQWLRQYPNHTLVPLRGNVNTRLEKLQHNAWNGAIFAAAGLERIQLRPTNSLDLDWMLPAPAQGTIAVFCRENDSKMGTICQQMNHIETDICTYLERIFLKKLLGGCSNPIAALATFEGDMLHFKGNILSRDGQKELVVERDFRCQMSNVKFKDIAQLGVICANDIKDKKLYKTLII
jgi:hydroxymethylbilane synthase